MKFKEIQNQLNFIGQCRQYNLSLWQCPSFLTVVMGMVTIIVMGGTYLVANRFADEPEMAALIVVITTLVIFIIGYLIVNSFSYLAEANRMKSEFVSITSHQLRTPLSSSKWSLNLLMDEDGKKLDEKQKEYLTIIKESTERMIKLVNDLLDVSRIEQGRLLLKPQNFSISYLIKELVTELSPLSESRKIKIVQKIDEDLPDVWADSERIRLVIQNLIDNAIKYSPERGQIEIRTLREGSRVKCEIDDQGIGVPKDQRNQVFQKFFRSDNARKQQTTGTGLGLFIAKGIVEASSGEIGFRSKEKEGSIFWFTIPIKNYR